MHINREIKLAPLQKQKNPNTTLKPLRTGRSVQCGRSLILLSWSYNKTKIKTPLIAQQLIPFHMETLYFQVS